MENETAMSDYELNQISIALDRFCKIKSSTIISEKELHGFFKLQCAINDELLDPDVIHIIKVMIFGI